MSKNKHTPPPIADRLLEWYCNPDLLEDLQGDLYERFEYHTNQHGKRKASFLYFWDVVRFMKPYTIRRTEDNGRNSSFHMFSHYFKTSYRSLLKQRLNSTVNIAGLSLGLCAFILICLYVNDELQYDRYLPNADRIYRLTLSYTSELSSEHSAWSEPAVGQVLQEKYPEVEATTAIVNEKVRAKSFGETFSEDRFYFTDKGYFKVFPHTFQIGSPKAFLHKKVVLTASTANKYFGDTNPMNQVLEINKTQYEVVGVIDDIPFHTDLKFDALICRTDISDFSGWTYNYLSLNRKADIDNFTAKLGRIYDEVLGDEFEDYGVKDGQYHIEALTDVHFSSKKLFDTPKSSKTNLYLFSSVAFLILLAASINYINISLASAARRQAEVGIRKSIGAQNNELKSQFFLDALIICTLSVVIAIGLTAYGLPYLNALTDKQIHWLEMFGPTGVVFLLTLTFFLTIVAGSYPALYLSSVKPTDILKGKVVLKGKKMLRHILVVSQFTISIVLIISTIIIFRQLELVQQTSHGFTEDQVILIDIPDENTKDSKAELFKNTILQYPFVTAASLVGYNSWPTADRSVEVYEVSMNESWQMKPFNEIEVDESYFDALGLKFTHGKSFSAKDMTATNGTVVVNEALVEGMKWDNPLEQVINNEDGYEYKVIGVIEDFHYNSFKQDIEPMFIFPAKWSPSKMLVRLRADQNPHQGVYEHIELMEKAWKSSMTGEPFEFEFLDYYVAQQYKSDRTLKKVFTVFMVIAMSIAALGLFGLISLYTHQKMKEVSVRKIFGARVSQLFITLSKEFITLIFVAFAIAIPLSVLSTNLWLTDFVYKTSFSIEVFLTAGGLTSLIALCTMSYHIIKATQTNPTSILKNE